MSRPFPLRSSARRLDWRGAVAVLLAAALASPAPAQESPAALASIAQAHRIVEGECSEPVIAELAPDRALAVFVTHEFGVGDRLLATEVTPSRRGAVEVVRPGPARIVLPTLTAASDDEAVCVWTEVAGDLPASLHFARRTAEGWSSPQTLPRPGSALHAELANTPEGVRLVWQELVGGDERRPRYAIFTALLQGDRLVAIDQLTDRRFSGWDPAIGVGPRAVTIGWSQYGGRDYEVVARRHRWNDEQWLPTTVISRDQVADDLHVSLATDPKGDTWFAWDGQRDLERGRSFGGLSKQDRALQGSPVRLAVWRASGELERPRAALPGSEKTGATPTSVAGSYPHVIAQADGGVQLLHRYLDAVDGEELKDVRFSFPLIHRNLTEDGWSAPRRFATSEAAAARFSVAGGRAGTWVAWQFSENFDHLGQPIAESVPEEALARLRAQGITLIYYKGPHGIGIAYVPQRSGTSPVCEALPQQIEMVRRHPLTDPESHPIVLSDQHLQVEYQGNDLSVYWGDLHRHTSISRCNQGREASPHDRYAFSRDVYLYDFLALTDHALQMGPLHWWEHRKLVDLYAAGDFVTFAGYEWGGPKFGHFNIVLRENLPRIVTVGDGDQSPELLWETLPDGSALTIPHHTSLTRAPFDWSKSNADHLRIAEIFQSCRGSFEFRSCFRNARSALVGGTNLHDAFSRGVHVGIIASSDHGPGAAYAAVLAKSLDRESIWDALVARRTYGCTTKGMLIDFRVEGALMGEVVRAEGDLELSLTARGTRELVHAVVYRDGEVVWSRGLGDEPESVFNAVRNREYRLHLEPTLGTPSLEESWTIPGPVKRRSWFAARIVQADGEVAWSSPVLVRRERER